MAENIGAQPLLGLPTQITAGVPLWIDAPVQTDVHTHKWLHCVKDYRVLGLNL